MPAIVIRLATLEDAPQVAALVRTLDLHYAGADATQPLAPTLAMVERSMREAEGTRYALAFRDGRPVGLACFAVLRPGFRLSGLLFVKELFVEDQARGQAVGAGLMRWLADHARTLGLTRIDLTTEGTNMRAQAFYERLGAERMDKVFYRFNLSTGVLSDD
ncbi:GNAT family N-acetyltransferase [Microvirga lotononidis]|uniref:Acetyltransferase, N-acetylglutamate synthase n=1 Tax=Microvirga lotononidis TaxID=864069 RepID=I4YZG9_9HYPH|nr:GNAT family N-acetyltransferase [Microvirga lotononidis]EIM29361.1 acetyltransferase, N-acetylglutamate synthase [Microvirga lotononidis]WQO29186.1 GNAT family N-acetyltransferase [Microvirga lotononidis]